MKTERLVRIIQILAAMQSGNQFTVDDLAKMFGVSRRTIFRDVACLAEAGFKHHYHKKSCSYSLTNKPHLPSLQLDPDEALGLMMLVRSAARHECFPFSANASRAACKLANVLPDDIQKYCKQVLQSVSFNSSQHCQPVDEKVFFQLQTAIYKKRVVSINYHPGNGSDFMLNKFQPHHLSYDSHKWYVIGNTRSDERMHAIDIALIEDVTVCDESFLRDSSISIHHEQLERMLIKQAQGDTTIKTKKSQQVVAAVSIQGRPTIYGENGMRS